MFRFIMIVNTVLCTYFSQAQTSEIRGQVIDSESNLPVTGANVLLNYPGKGEESNYSGEFTFINLEPGKFKLKISYIGYETHEQIVIVEKGKIVKIQIALQPAFYQTDEYVVTGSRIEIARSNVPMSISTISRKEIEESNESNILPVISERIPGVFVSERGVTGYGVAAGSAGNISIRGIGGSPNTEVLMLIDGHPQSMGLFGHPLPDAYVSSDVERVEVIRGPASLLYGSNAMGGVINIITRKQDMQGIIANGQLLYGSFNTQKYMANLGYKKKKMSLFASINHDRTDGHRENSDFEITNGYLKAGYVLSPKLKIVADFSLAGFRSVDPGPATKIDSSYLIDIHWVDIIRGKAAISLENKFNTFNGALKVYSNFGEHDIYDGFHSNDINSGVIFYQALSLIKNNIITFGMDYKNYGGKAENVKAIQGEGVVFADTTINELGSYVFVQQSLAQKFILTAGLRIENNKNNGVELVPQFGVSFIASNSTTLKASVSKGFRNPTIRELYMWNPANPTLLPERMWNYELTWNQKLFKDKLNFEITGFYAEGTNMITMQGPPLLRYENTGNFIHKGIEVSSAYLVNSDFKVSSSYSFLDTDKPTLAAPRHQFYLSGNYSVRKFSIYISGNYIGELFTQTVMPEEQSYFLLNAKLSYKPLKFIEFFVKAENLLNKKYEINFDYPMPGIYVLSGIQFHYINYKKNV